MKSTCYRPMSNPACTQQLFMSISELQQEEMEQSDVETSASHFTLAVVPQEPKLQVQTRE